MEHNYLNQFKDTVENKIQQLNPSDVINVAIKVPGVKIDRSVFLNKELSKFYMPEIVNEAISLSPAQAGISLEQVDMIAKHCINYETDKVAAISFAAGLPGGVAAVAGIGLDTAQYFAFIIRIMQKLMYLYGFPEIEIRENKIDDETMELLIVFFGVMYGVEMANAAVKALAEQLAKTIEKRLANKALMRTFIYPIVKKVAGKVGVRMTREIFAKSVSKTVPIIGGITSGGLSYATYKPCAKRLQKSFRDLPIANPNTFLDS